MYVTETKKTEKTVEKLLFIQKLKEKIILIIKVIKSLNSNIQFNYKKLNNVNIKQVNVILNKLEILILKSNSQSRKVIKLYIYIIRVLYTLTMSKTLNLNLIYNKLRIYKKTKTLLNWFCLKKVIKVKYNSLIKNNATIVHSRYKFIKVRRLIAESRSFVN